MTNSEKQQVIENFLTHVRNQGAIKDQTATEDEAAAYYELDAPVVEALVGFLKTVVKEEAAMKRDYPAWANIVAGCFKEVHAWHTAIAWSSELQSEQTTPAGFPTYLSPFWGDRDVVVYIAKDDHSHAAVFYGDEVRARGLEFLTRDRDDRVKVLGVFNEVF